MKIPVIIDCDPGLDDAVALALAGKSENIDIKGVTVVAGNQVLEKTLENALKVLSYAQIQAPVAAGCSRPIVRALETAPHIHGETGLGGVNLPEPSIVASKLHAVELTARIIRESKEKVTLVALGPLTNIAMFIRLYPQLALKIERVSLMGGAVRGGNCRPAAEFNIFVDPEAADIVFRSGIPVIMAGLDVTHQAYLNPAEIESFRKIGNKVAVLAADLMTYYLNSKKAMGTPRCNLHDPVALIPLLKPKILETKKMRVDVELYGTHTAGMTVVDVNGRLGLPPNAEVCLDIDRLGFIALLMETFQKYGV